MLSCCKRSLSILATFRKILKTRCEGSVAGEEALVHHQYLNILSRDEGRRAATGFPQRTCHAAKKGSQYI
jgi:hypothetical protein